MPSQESLFKFVGIVLVFSAFDYFNSNFNSILFIELALYKFINIIRINYKY